MKNSIRVLLLLPMFLFAQSSWKRGQEKPITQLNLFQSSQTANLPTTETLNKGDFIYEISHRFGSISSGNEGLYGLDGPVTMRMALGYGITNDLMLTVGRSNIQDNLDIKAKYKLTEFHSEIPFVIAVQAGWAINTEAYAGINKRKAFDTHSFQYYGQLILNTMLPGEKLGAGVVPSFVYNSFIFTADYDSDPKYTMSIPSYLQYNFNRMWSFFIEYTPVIKGWKGNIHYNAHKNFSSHNTVAGGIAIDTGGHVFYLFLTNNERLNPSQFLIGGAGTATKSENWRLAFGITREL